MDSRCGRSLWTLVLAEHSSAGCAGRRSIADWSSGDHRPWHQRGLPSPIVGTSNALMSLRRARAEIRLSAFGSDASRRHRGTISSAGDAEEWLENHDAEEWLENHSGYRAHERHPPQDNPGTPRPTEASIFDTAAVQPGASGSRTPPNDMACRTFAFANPTQ